MFGKKKKQSDNAFPSISYDRLPEDNQPSGTVMSEETKRRILLESQTPSGQMWTPQQYIPTGSMQHGRLGQDQTYALDVNGRLNLQDPRAHNLEIDVDKLWEKMYEHMRKVIVVCKYCNRPQTIDNEVCSGCGAPLPVKFIK